MGFQLMHILTAWNLSVLCEYCAASLPPPTLSSPYRILSSLLGYDSKNISWPLQLTPSAASSRFFRGVQKETIRTLTEEASTFNWHHDGMADARTSTPYSHVR